jgi:phospho-N-acetylmuramoyl-pentapeptide-transferase
MFYYLFDYLDKHFNMPGAGVFQYISFRAALAIILSLIITTVFGKVLITYLRVKQVGETVRNLGLEGQMQKQGTPTMGGIIILLAILVPTILFAKLHNVYILLLIFSALWLGLIGFIDDYIKVFKKNKEGLKGTFKVIGQVGLGIIVGTTLYFNKHVVIREKIQNPEQAYFMDDILTDNVNLSDIPRYEKEMSKSTKTTIPLVKDNEFDYADILSFLGDGYEKYAWLIYIPIVIIIITAVSNGANITDGIDGLATGTSAIIGATLGIFAYVSGNTIFADYLNFGIILFLHKYLWVIPVH